jgi:hypothetical protein
MGEVNWDGVAQDIVRMMIEEVGRAHLRKRPVDLMILERDILNLLLDAAEQIQPKTWREARPKGLPYTAEIVSKDPEHQ